MAYDEAESSHAEGAEEEPEAVLPALAARPHFMQRSASPGEWTARARGLLTRCHEHWVQSGCSGSRLCKMPPMM